MEKGNVVHLQMEYYTAEKKQWHLEICRQMGRARKHHIEWGNPDPERQLSYVFTHKWFLDIKQRKASLQITIPKNLDNKDVPKKDIHGSNLQGT